LRFIDYLRNLFRLLEIWRCFKGERNILVIVGWNKGRGADNLG